ncbi:hypothetical protein HY502_03425 [Candidatus Woesebacteria bacterium]|nr:hypothetical protein [Candidatus Woesebacteria bacterium]
MPIEIKEFTPEEAEPKTYTLELGDDKVYFAIGKKGIVVRIATDQGSGRDVGVIQFDTQDLTVSRNGSKVIRAPFYTWPGEKITVEKRGSNKHLEIRHLAANKETT